MQRKNNVVELQDEKLPEDQFKDASFEIDHTIRTNGGFGDAIFLSSLLLTGALWAMILMVLGR